MQKKAENKNQHILFHIQLNTLISYTNIEEVSWLAQEDTKRKK